MHEFSYPSEAHLFSSKSTTSRLDSASIVVGVAKSNIVVGLRATPREVYSYVPPRKYANWPRVVPS